MPYIRGFGLQPQQMLHQQEEEEVTQSQLDP